MSLFKVSTVLIKVTYNQSPHVQLLQHYHSHMIKIRVLGSWHVFMKEISLSNFYSSSFGVHVDLCMSFIFIWG